MMKRTLRIMLLLALCALFPGLGVNLRAAEQPFVPAPVSPQAQSSPAPAQTQSPQAPAQTQELPIQPSIEQKAIRDIMDKVVQRLGLLNRGMCPVALSLRMKMGILAMPMELAGEYYYLHPDKNLLKLTKIPSVLSKYPRYFIWNNADFNRFSYTFLPGQAINGVPCHVLRLDALHPADEVRQRDLWVSKLDYTTPRQIFRFADGEVRADLKYRKESNYLLFDRVVVELDFPPYSLTANVDARCGNYALVESTPPASSASSTGAETPAVKPSETGPGNEAPTPTGGTPK